VETASERNRSLAVFLSSYSVANTVSFQRGQSRGSESGVRVGTLTPTLDGFIRGRTETQIGQIAQIGQRVSNVNSRGIAQRPNRRGNGLGTHWFLEAVPSLSPPWRDATVPSRDYSLRDLRDLPNLRPGSIGAQPAWRMRGGVRVPTLTPNSDPNARIDGYSMRRFSVLAVSTPARMSSAARAPTVR
jgi:hypothetical protein